MGDTNMDENTSNNGTCFKEIFSLFLGTIQDYNLKNMFIYIYQILSVTIS